MKNIAAVVFSLAMFCAPNVFAQIRATSESPKTLNSTKSSAAHYDNSTKSASKQTEISRERRAQAYAKLLEGQRYLWSMSRLRSQAGMSNGARFAKESLQKAVELDPTLAEAYTALAELTLTAPPNNLDEAIMLANIAIKINPDNYGGHRILARLYTINSKLNRGDLNANFTDKAIAAWKEIARLDPRSAEAYAFLSEFYAKTNQPAERIEALKNWLSAGAPLETRFYETIMGGQQELSAENASLKLGSALLEGGQTREAIEILSRTVAENSENVQAVELLREAVESADGDSAMIAAQALTQAVYANPENASLIVLLAQIQARSGKIDEAAKTLTDSAAKLAEKDVISAANMQIALGDIYDGADRFDEAVKAYENALTVRGVEQNNLIQDDKRDFAIRVFGKIIQTYKKANRPNDAKSAIERAGNLLGKNDLFADRQLINFYRETGKTAEALQTVRTLRARSADDYGLLRLEASVLTDSGRVDEAVALIKPLIEKKKSASVSGGTGAIQTGEAGTLTMSAPMFDDFTNYLFISNLYSQAKRGKEAVEAANQAIAVSQGDERKQIAKLTLATAQQMSGSYDAAEQTLRELLKQSAGNPIALNNLGYFLVERNTKLDEALSLIKQAIKIDSTNPSYLDSLGWAYFKLGNLELAEKYLKDALRADTASATIQEHLGDVYQKQGKLELAKSVWQKSLTLAVETEQISRLKTKLNVNK